MRLLMYILSLALFLSCQSQEGEYDSNAIREAISSQMTSYPSSTLKDIYKNFFQDAFGPGHLMSDSEDAQRSMERYLRSETEEARKEADPSPFYVQTGWRGNFYRVNLSVINDGKVPFDTLLDALMESAASFTLPEIEEWSREWNEIERIFRETGYEVEDYEMDSEAIQALLSEGKYASHHSKRYEEAYHPHYRLIEKNIFTGRILPLLEK